MRKSIIFFAFVCILQTMGASLVAKDKAIGKAGSVIYVQEITSTFQVVFNRYCPVNSAKKFQQHCKKDKHYNLRQPIVNPNVDWIKTGQYKYMAQWVPSKAAGNYAWVGGKGGLSDYSLSEETLLARFAPGMVIVESHYTKGPKAKRDAAVKRAKAALRSKYGAIIDKMKFAHVTVAKVKCLKRKEAPKDGNNCTLL